MYMRSQDSTTAGPTQLTTTGSRASSKALFIVSTTCLQWSNRGQQDASIVDTNAEKGEAHLMVGQHILSCVTIHVWSRGRKVDQYIERCVTVLASHICEEANAVSSGGNSPRSNLISLGFKVSHTPAHQTGGSDYIILIRPKILTIALYAAREEYCGSEPTL